MPWNETAAVNERVKFIAAHLENEDPFFEICERFGISRKTGYKWLARYEAGGVAALADRSSAPKVHPNAVSQEVVREILDTRERRPYGARKLVAFIRRRRPDLSLPAASTVGEILRKNGLVGKKRRRRQRSSPYPDRLGGYDKPNAVWCADFKGHFPVAGVRCSPLTITDGFSRLLLCCDALDRPTFSYVRKSFERTFREFGMPDAIRTDNGAPFSSLAPAGLSRLAVWWIHLGIRPERIKPGRPDQNGRHERMHLTLKTAACSPPRSSFRAQQRAFDTFRDEYNNVRPHEALGQQTPASAYSPSTKAFPDFVPQVEYPSHFRVAKAYSNGFITFRGIQWSISNCVGGELIGLDEVDDDRWKVYFGPVALGLLDVQNARHKYARSFGAMLRTDGVVEGRRHPHRHKPR